jgi:serine/threonine protein kinase
VADFGVASFTDELIATTVETGPTQRLANFMYAAPEQRIPGGNAGIPADIWALGLMLNELFTSRVPHGTEFELIGKSHPDFGYLDTAVAKMMRQAPGERFESIAKLKSAIAAHRSEFLSLQKISKINATVIPAGEVDEPLAHEAPRLAGAEWIGGTLVLTLDRPVDQKWIQALHNMGSFSSVLGCPPQAFQFRDCEARVGCKPHEAQHVIDHFKAWLPQATRMLKYNLENEARLQQSRLQEQLRAERAAEEERLRVNKALKI